jgi:hypothetical protein
VRSRNRWHTILAALAAPLALPIYYWTNEMGPEFSEFPVAAVTMITAYLTMLVYGYPLYAWLQRKGWANILTAALLGLTAIVVIVPLFAPLFMIVVSKGEGEIWSSTGQLIARTLIMFRAQPFVYIVPAVVVGLTFHGLVRGLNWLVPKVLS